jgi:hypothetical protein
MPFGDGTGPRGLGPMTGRQTGFCAGYTVPGYANFGAGWACWGGGGRGRRNRYYASGLTGWQRAGTGWIGAGEPFGAPMSREYEIDALKTQAQNLAHTLDTIRKQIETLEAQGRTDAQ